jgi:hypothetical protein
MYLVLLQNDCDSSFVGWIFGPVGAPFSQKMEKRKKKKRKEKSVPVSALFPPEYLGSNERKIRWRDAPDARSTSINNRADG